MQDSETKSGRSSMSDGRINVTVHGGDVKNGFPEKVVNTHRFGQSYGCIM
jgi:hypothetical protein